MSLQCSQQEVVKRERALPVPRNYQRERAEEAVRRVKGVNGVMNLMQVKPKAAPEDITRSSRRHTG